MADEVPDAVFEPDGDRFVPSALARGPWDPGAQHGGAPAALVARAVERVPAPSVMQVTRCTYELLRPVPMTPLTVQCDVLRAGKRVQVVDAAVLAGDDVVVRARALRVRRADVPVGRDQPPTLPPPNACPAFAFSPAGAGVGFHTVFEFRSAAGSWLERGPAAVWFRAVRPLVAGEDTSPLMRACAVADFGNGISAELPFDRYQFINPDLTVALARDPIGEWIALDAQTVLSEHGTAMATSALHDESGRMGSAVQSLYVDTR